MTARPGALSLVDVAIAVGHAPAETLKNLADAAGWTLRWPDGLSHRSGHAVVWFPRDGKAPFSMRILPGRVERLRHLRKYAEGNTRDRSFYFRGPEAKLNLRAQNLMIFKQLAEGVDDETWLYHLRRGEYSDWFRLVIHDDELAEEASHAEQNDSAQESRQRILTAIERRYTAPA